VPEKPTTLHRSHSTSDLLGRHSVSKYPGGIFSSSPAPQREQTNPDRQNEQSEQSGDPKKNYL